MEGGGKCTLGQFSVALQQECLRDAIRLAKFWGSHSHYFNGCHSHMAVLRGVTSTLLNSGGVTPIILTGVTPIWLC